MSIIEEHKKKIQYFESKGRLKMALYQDISDLSNIKASIPENDVFEILNIDDKIHTLYEEIDKLSTNDDVNYLLKVSGILGQYEKYDGNEKEDTTSSTLFFPTNTLQQFVQQRTNNSRGKLYNLYMNVVNNICPQHQIHANPSNDIIRCSECNQVMQMSVNESYMVCNQCGEYLPYFEPTISGLTYEQEINTDTNIHFSYKRINHLRELLAQLQAKESSEIPDEIINGVCAEFKKSRIQSTSEITQDKVKLYLKKLGFNKYYEHTRQITNILNGKPPPKISNELYEKLINMFIDIQEPFEKACPKNRKNFFSYNYILYKFCELLDEKETMKLFPLLKSREKLYQQDCIWKDICKLKKWPFYKSV